MTSTGSETNTPPEILRFTANVTGLFVVFDFEAFDADGDDLSFGISFSFDGNESASGRLEDGIGQVTHTYAEAGTYSVGLAVADDFEAAGAGLELELTVDEGVETLSCWIILGDPGTDQVITTGPDSRYGIGGCQTPPLLNDASFVVASYGPECESFPELSPGDMFPAGEQFWIFCDASVYDAAVSISFATGTGIVQTTSCWVLSGLPSSPTVVSGNDHYPGLGGCQPAPLGQDSVLEGVSYGGECWTSPESAVGDVFPAGEQFSILCDETVRDWYVSMSFSAA